MFLLQVWRSLLFLGAKFVFIVREVAHRIQ